jgi:hypothetical protein
LEKKPRLPILDGLEKYIWDVMAGSDVGLILSWRTKQRAV